MRADFSRQTFDALKHYTGVLHQQGRVWLDADWNEEVLNRLYLLQQETRDIIGDCGVPDPGTAFQIKPNPDPKSAPDDFVIAGGPGPAGHFYVDGILCRLEHDVTYLTQPDFPDPPRLHLQFNRRETRAVVYLEVWHRLITYLQDEKIREIALGGPDTATRLKTIAQVKVLPLPPDAENVTCENVQLPGPGKGTLTTLPPVDTQPPDPCRLPDPSTYTGRENHLYRVEIHDGGDVLGSTTGFTASRKLAQDAAAGAVTLTLASTPQSLSDQQIEAFKRAGVVRLSDDTGQTEVVPVANVTGTSISLARGLQNSFTVANNATVTGGVARFKWSRDNAAFAVGVTAVAENRQTLTLTSLGRDQATTLRQGDLVEISDDASELGPSHGLLTYLTADPDPDAFTVSIAERLPANFVIGGVTSPVQSPVTAPGTSDRHLILRRWDGWGWANTQFSETGTPDMNLGDGIHIQFGGSDLRSGDYWQFAARSTDGSIEILNNAPPSGIIRHTCPLAIVRWSVQVRLNLDQVFAAFRRAQFSDAQLKQVDQFLQQLRNNGQDTMTTAAIEDLAQQIGAIDDQIATLRKIMQDSDGRRQLVFEVIDDCRTPFDPLTKQRCKCECTVTVAPGESLAAAIDKIGEGGGVVCLLPGHHILPDTLTVVDKDRLTLRGAGAATVVSAPNSAIAMLFQDCDNLTITDLAVNSGKGIALQSPPASDLTNRLERLDVTPAAAETAVVVGTNNPFAGVITCVTCRSVRITGCNVTCLAISDQRRVGRACITFIGNRIDTQPASPPVVTGPVGTPGDTTPTGTTGTVVTGSGSIRPHFALGTILSNLGNRIDLIRNLNRVTGTAGQPVTSPPETATGTPADLHTIAGRLTRAAGELGTISTRAQRINARPVDLTVRDCRLAVDPGQHGIVVADSNGAHIEDTWALARTLLAQLGLDEGQASADRSLRGSFGIVSIEGDLIMVNNNLIAGFNQAMLSNSQNVTIRDNFAALCNRGITVSNINSLLLVDNLLGTDQGPSLEIRDDQGELNMQGNQLLSTAIQQGQIAVADITLQTALLSGNSFHAAGTVQPNMAVSVQAQNITYNANRSVCDMLPLKTNVLLRAPSDDKRPGIITAAGNTCVEPPTQAVPPIRGRFHPPEQNQEKLLDTFLSSTDQQSQNALLTNLQNAANQWAALERVTEITGIEIFRPSLIAVGGVAVTGLNILSYRLIRAGRGSDQGSVINAF